MVNSGIVTVPAPVWAYPKDVLAIRRRIGAHGQNNHAGLGFMTINVSKSGDPIEVRGYKNRFFIRIRSLELMPIAGGLNIGANAQQVGKLVQRDAGKAGLLVVLIERSQRAVIPVDIAFRRFPQQVKALRGEAVVPKDVLEECCGHSAELIRFRRISFRESG